MKFRITTVAAAAAAAATTAATTAAAVAAATVVSLDTSYIQLVVVSLSLQKALKPAYKRYSAPSQLHLSDIKTICM